MFYYVSHGMFFRGDYLNSCMVRKISVKLKLKRQRINTVTFYLRDIRRR